MGILRWAKHSVMLDKAIISSLGIGRRLKLRIYSLGRCATCRAHDFRALSTCNGPVWQ
jgi:hypothetical protein